jgi:hypothetical protein
VGELVTNVAEGTLELDARQDDNREGDGGQQDHEECIFDKRLARLSAPSLHDLNDGSIGFHPNHPPFGLN